MSDDAYARHTAREVKFWAPFVYSYPFSSAETAERVIIFGLYANAYLNGQAYLTEIEDAELANLLAEYNGKIAGLTNQEAIVVADIAAKRYLAGIDKLIHDKKLETQQQKIDMENEMADARYAALAADRAALETLAAKVAAETEKTSARITELQAMIAIEGINYSQVELEVAEKELQSLRVDNQMLDVANEILRIQIQTVRTATELLDIDVQMARTLINIAETERAIARIGLLANELTIEQAETAIEEAKIPISESRIALAQAKYDDTAAELLYIVNTLMARADIDKESKEELINLEANIKEYALQRSQEKDLLNNDLKLQASDAEIEIAEDDQTAQGHLDALKENLLSEKANQAWDNAYNAIEALRTILTADIGASLSHTIKKAT